MTSLADWFRRLTGRLPSRRRHERAVRSGRESARRPLSPESAGFGRLWEKEISTVLLAETTPEDVMAYWRGHLADLWPESGEVALPSETPQPGDTLGVDIAVGPTEVATGVTVTEATPTSLTLTTPQGHMFAGTNRLVTERDPTGVRLAVRLSVRAADPVFELALSAGGHRAEELFWAEMLRNVAAHYGERPPVRLRRRLRDRNRRWGRLGNLRHNALIRTSLQRLFNRGAGS